jgi:hypothetical protein
MPSFGQSVQISSIIEPRWHLAIAAVTGAEMFTLGKHCRMEVHPVMGQVRHSRP